MQEKITWTPDKLQFIADNVERLGYTGLAEHFNVTRNMIAGIIWRRKLTRTNQRHEKAQDLKMKIIMMWPNYSSSAISNKLQISFTRVISIAKKCGLIVKKERIKKHFIKKPAAKSIPLVINKAVFKDGGMRVIDIGPRNCRYPIGEARDLIWCGAHTEKTYCSHHHAISYPKSHQKRPLLTAPL